MKKNIIVICMLLIAVTVSAHPGKMATYLDMITGHKADFASKTATFNDSTSIAVKRDTVTWIDTNRNRPVPVALYSANEKVTRTHFHGKQPLVILNPGYSGKNTDYSYIATTLAKLGYYVVTVQHNLPADAPIPTVGNLYQSRLPFWNAGVMNILFVIDRLKAIHPNLDHRHLILIGHSYGGDIVMLLAQQHPQMVSAAISLDNRRVPFPRNKHIRIFSIRSNDQIADPGVLPSLSEQRKYPISMVKVNTTHEDMGGFGTTQQLNEINHYIVAFLSGHTN
ncbi:alpha/beta hydrolase family protein [Mucilaginibacter sp. SJ]|uniref:alpha/beta hydrolase family protein n=1 Tax=Mucilaginibacter sp. SJ TaxID=3029053 RepID=UPI0023A93F73|nr:alpha/beta fold hydrolase [Mucilaginibacter sp. SJ]WEA00582.1 alpha/beta fold hydrolase [Mucilaginibacter sp. SJ]